MVDTRKTNDTKIESQLKVANTELKDGVFIFSAPMSVGDFAKKIKKPVALIISHFFKQGKMININNILNVEEIAELCIGFGYDFKKEEEVSGQKFMDNIKIEDSKQALKKCPPIVSIMGHVDHGKTTLIDKIRNSNLAQKETGGITQHTGAYQVEHKGQKITFLDTPGHEAFTAMRARGAQLTNIVIIVVAADDSVMPQTKESISHAVAAKVPIIIFINKIDKPQVDTKKVINDLLKYEIVVEAKGGDVQCVEGSALKGQGIDQLFDAIILQAEMLEIKADPNRMPIGVVVDSRIDKGKGVIATLIVKNGSLHHRDFIVAGSNYGKIRSMEDTNGIEIKKALPGTPIIITGLNYVPNAGDKFFGLTDEKLAKKLASQKASLDKQNEQKEKTLLKTKGHKKVLSIIIKADIQGTLEAIKNALLKLSNEEIQVNVIQASTGMITNADILLAQASNSMILGFNIFPNLATKNEAKANGIEIKSYSIIYKMIEDLQNVITGLEAPKYVEKITGEATIHKIIYFSKVGKIAGCTMDKGTIFENSKVRLIRNNKVIYSGEIDSLQRGKDAAKKVEAGKEFGTHIKNYNDIKELDLIQAYSITRVEK